MSAVHYPLTASQVIATMENDGKTDKQFTRVRGIIAGTGRVFSVSVREKVAIPPKLAKFYYVHLNPKRSAIFIHATVKDEKLSGILSNVKTSSIAKSGTGRSASRSSRSSPSSRSSSKSSRSRSSKRRRSSRSKSPKRRRSKSPKRRSRSRRRSSKRR